MWSDFILFFLVTCDLFDVSAVLKNFLWPDFCFCLILEKQENKGRMRYLLGESLGGAVALLLHRKKPDFWDGAVLVAPMCKVTLYIMSFTFGLSPLSSLSDYFLFSKVTSSFGSFSLYIFIYIHGLPTKLDPVLVTFLLLSVFLFFILSMIINFNENKN